MKKLVILMMVVMTIMCGCAKQSEALPKGEIPNERLVIKDGEVVGGRASWDKFFGETTEAKSAGNADMEKKIFIDFYYSEDVASSGKEEYYEMELSYIDGKYTYKGITEGTEVTYEYLIERSGKLENAAVKSRGYYLVNDENVTYEELAWSLISSQSADWIEHKIVFFDTIEE